jgi:hypothetical protein
MDQSEQIDHAEHDAVRGEAEREAQAELMEATEEHVTQLIRFAREVPTGSQFDMVDAVAGRVLELNLNVGELATIVGMVALGLGRPETLKPVVARLAKHLYDQAHDSKQSPATDDDHYRGYVARRWNDDPEMREKYHVKAAALLAIAFDV